jgi:outer membrane protein assembly factor BamB
MKLRLVLSLCWLARCGLLGSELRYEVVWTLPGQGGFSAPNALYEPGAARPSFLVVAERDRGITAVTLDGKRLWEFPLEPPVTAAPAVADVNGDGHEEVVAADSKGNLVVLDAAGQELWRAHTIGGVRADSCPAVADLDGDGAPEIVIGDQAGTLSCFDRVGKLKWQFTGDGSQMGPVLCADIYDTPGLELIVTSHDQHVYALTARGEWLWDLYYYNDLFPISTPILADADGDRIPELYVGGGLHHFYRIDLAKAQTTLAENVYLHVNAAIQAADLDGDGKTEVVFGNKGGAVWCYGAKGFQWTRAFPQSAMYAAPALFNLDNDPDLEIIFFSLFGDVQVLDADGTQISSGKIPCNAMAAPLVGDLNGDGVLDAVVTAGESGAMALVNFGIPYRRDARERGVFSGNRAHTGTAPARDAYTLLPIPGLPTTGKESATASIAGEIGLLGGPNTWRFEVQNSEQRHLALLSKLSYPDGSVRFFASHVGAAQERRALSFEIEQAGNYSLEQKLVDTGFTASGREFSAAQRHRLRESSRTLSYAGLQSDQAYLADTVFGPTREALKQWDPANPDVRRGFFRRLEALEGVVPRLAKLDQTQRTPLLANATREGLRLRELARAGGQLARQRTFAAWQFNPWSFFDPEQTLPRAEVPTGKIEADLCLGEYESLALNLTAFSDRTLEVRVRCDDFAGPTNAPAAAHVEFRRAVLVPTEWREMVADALPKLDQGGLIRIPAHTTEQLWITLNAKALAPGAYTANLRLASIEPDPSEVVLPIQLRVHNLELPRPLWFCLWAYEGGPLGTQNDAVLTDLVEHGVTVFFGRPPTAESNDRGELTRPLDFAEHDSSVRRYSPHGVLLFLSPQHSVKGSPFLSDPWKTAFVAYLREWVTHQKALGLSYQQWALYPYDEPSTPFSKTTLDLVAVAKLIRAADPRIRIYADPTSGTTLESVELLKGLIDIWCPSSELLERLGDEMLPIVKKAGEVWVYDAAGRSKTLSCLGIYRWRFWHAWNQALTGVGWWTYAQHADVSRWLGPNPTGDFFATVYEGPDGPVSSKRWEAAREGIEDYALLFLLRQRLERAAARGVDVSEVKRLLAELPPRVEQDLLSTGRRLPLNPDSTLLYDDATRRLRVARAEIISTCLRLGE